MRNPRTPNRPDGPNRPVRNPTTRPPRPPKPEAPDLWEDDEDQGPERLQKISGLQAVTALFRRSPDRAVRLYYGEEMKKAAGPFCSEMAKLRRPYRLLEEDELAKVAGTPLHGGIVAAATPREVAAIGFQELGLWSQSRKPLIILDGIGNPNNLGAIARTMAFFGLEHLLLSDHPEQSGLSDSAYRVAEGGLEYLKIARIPNLMTALRSLRQYYRVIGTSLEQKAVTLESLTPDRRRPVALILGNEQFGLGKQVLASCEAVITVPGKGQIQSLNVAATAAILVHQLTAATTGKPAGNKPRRPDTKPTFAAKKPSPGKSPRQKSSQ